MPKTKKKPKKPVAAFYNEVLREFMESKKDPSNLDSLSYVELKALSMHEAPPVDQQDGAQTALTLISEPLLSKRIENTIYRLEELMEQPELQGIMNEVWKAKKEELKKEIQSWLTTLTKPSFLSRSINKTHNIHLDNSGFTPADIAEKQGKIKTNLAHFEVLAKKALEDAHKRKGLYNEVLQEHNAQGNLAPLSELEDKPETPKAAEIALRLINKKLRLPTSLEDQIAQLKKLVNSPALPKSFKEEWDKLEAGIKNEINDSLTFLTNPANLPKMLEKEKGGFNKDLRRKKIEQFEALVSAFEVKANAELVKTFKDKINNYEVESTKGVFETPAESQKRIDNFLDEQGKKALYEGTKAKDSTEARNAFLDEYAKVLSRSDNHYKLRYTEAGLDPRLVNPEKEAIKIADLLGSEGFNAYKKAIEEEKASKAYRNAVFLRSTKHYPGLTWAKRLHLLVAGPSGGGKSYSAAPVVKAIGESVAMEKTSKNEGNYVVTIDGGTDRETSQMRLMVEQLAKKKGYTGVLDLYDETKLEIKKSVKKAVLTSRKLPMMSLVIPETFSNLLMTYYQKLRSEKLPSDFVEFFSEVQAPEGEKETFKDSVYRMGNSRAWNSNFDAANTSEFIISMNKRNLGSASKRYEDNFTWGKNRSKGARMDYLERLGAKANYIPIWSDLIYVIQKPGGDPSEWAQCKAGDRGPNLARLSKRDFLKWRAYKARNYKGGGFHPGLQSFEAWLNALRYGYALRPLGDFGHSDSNNPALFLEVTGDELHYRRHGSGDKEILKKNLLIGDLGPDKATLIFDAIQKGDMNALTPYCKQLLDLTDSPLQSKESPPLFKILKGRELDKYRLELKGEPGKEQGMAAFLSSVPKPFLSRLGFLAKKKSRFKPGESPLAKLSEEWQPHLDHARNGKVQELTQLFEKATLEKPLLDWAEGVIKDCSMQKPGGLLIPAGFVDICKEHKNERPLTEKGELAQWLKEVVPHDQQEALALFYKKQDEALAQLVVTPEGDIQPWLIKIIGANHFREILENTPGGIHAVLPQIFQAVEHLLQQSLAEAARTMPGGLSTSMMKFIAFTDVITRQQQAGRSSFTDEIAKLAELSKQRLPDLETKLVAENHLQNFSALRTQLLTQPRPSQLDLETLAMLTEISERLKSSISTNKQKLALEKVEIQPVSTPAPAPSRNSGSISAPAPATVSSSPHATETHLKLVLTQKNKVVSSATLVEQHSHLDKPAVARLTGLTGMLDTRHLLATLVCSSKDDPSRKNPNKLFLAAPKAERFFARILNELRTKHGAISRDTLYDVLSQDKELLGILETQTRPVDLGTLTDTLIQAYKNATEQPDGYKPSSEVNNPYSGDNYFPSDAFIKLAAQQVDFLAREYKTDKPHVVINPDCWDPHYVEAIMLYCSMKGYPKPDWQRSKEDWNLDPIAEDKQEAFNLYYKKVLEPLPSVTLSEETEPVVSHAPSPSPSPS